MAMNSCSFTGRLTADPQLVGEGKNLRLTFSLAVERDRKNDEGNRDVDFLDFVCWRGTAEFVASHFRKGDTMTVVNARENVRDYTDSNGIKRHKHEHDISTSTQIYFGSRRRDSGRDDDCRGRNDGDDDFIE